MNGTKYPLLFTYHDILAGNGFIAGIRIRGRSLMVEEKMGMSGSTESIRVASVMVERARRRPPQHSDRCIKPFSMTSQKRLRRLPNSRMGWRGSVRRRMRPMRKTWRKAVKLVRSGLLGSDWLDSRPADSDRGVEVVEITPCEEGELPVKQMAGTLIQWLG